MKFLLSSLHLASLCALSSRSVSSSQMVVSQSEDVTVKEGKTAEISCCWSTELSRGRIVWTKNQTEIQNDLVNRTSGSHGQSNCSQLKITNTTKEHSGTYFCKVFMEIPVYGSGMGTGTVITVKSTNETEEQKDNIHRNNSHSSALNFILIGLAVVSLVLFVALYCLCSQRRKQGQAARVIYEVPHFDSETQEMDKDSTGSSGSSQWCQVPVYESFDYFEHGEAKKTG